MFELSTGWQREDDPRKIKTWPISRSGFEEMEAKGIKMFTVEDSYALQDNVYADAINKLKGKDKNV